MPSEVTTLRRKTQPMLYNMSSEKLPEMALLFELDFEGCVGVFWAEKIVPVNSHWLLLTDLWVRPHSLGGPCRFFQMLGAASPSRRSFISP